MKNEPENYSPSGYLQEPSDSLIHIQNLLFRRNDRFLLDIERLEIYKGETLVLVGPNGAGKSTLLMILARLIKPERGRLFWKGQPFEHIPEIHYRRRIGLVLQEPLLFDMRVCQNIALGLKFRHIPKREIQQRVEFWMEQLEISHLANRRAGQLSGGEGQRVSLARALALQPELLLLDEPFASLDPPTRNRLIEDLGDILARHHTTTLFVTHHLEEIKHLSSRIAVMVDGKIQAIGENSQQDAMQSDLNWMEGKTIA